MSSSKCSRKYIVHRHYKSVGKLVFLSPTVSKKAITFIAVLIWSTRLITFVQDFTATKPACSYLFSNTQYICQSKSHQYNLQAKRLCLDNKWQSYQTLHRQSTKGPLWHLWDLKACPRLVLKGYCWLSGTQCPPWPSCTPQNGFSTSPFPRGPESNILWQTLPRSTEWLGLAWMHGLQLHTPLTVRCWRLLNHPYKGPQDALFMNQISTTIGCSQKSLSRQAPQHAADHSVSHGPSSALPLHFLQVWYKQEEVLYFYLQGD